VESGGGLSLFCVIPAQVGIHPSGAALDSQSSWEGQSKAGSELEVGPGARLMRPQSCSAAMQKVHFLLGLGAEEFPVADRRADNPAQQVG